MTGLYNKKMKIPEYLYIDIAACEACCKRCGEKEKLPLPMPISALGKWAEYIAEKHKYCRKKPEIMNH
jgi:rRNA maturation protein Nop10